MGLPEPVLVAGCGACAGAVRGQVGAGCWQPWTAAADGQTSLACVRVLYRQIHTHTHTCSGHDRASECRGRTSPGEVGRACEAGGCLAVRSRITDGPNGLLAVLAQHDGNNLRSPQAFQPFSFSARALLCAGPRLSPRALHVFEATLTRSGILQCVRRYVAMREAPTGQDFRHGGVLLRRLLFFD